MLLTVVGVVMKMVPWKAHGPSSLHHFHLDFSQTSVDIFFACKIKVKYLFYGKCKKPNCMQNNCNFNNQSNHSKKCIYGVTCFPLERIFYLWVDKIAFKKKKEKKKRILFHWLHSCVQFTPPAAPPVTDAHEGREKNAGEKGSEDLWHF